MVEAWPHVQLFHGEGVVSAILVVSFIRKEKKPKTFDFFWFWAPVTEEERKRQRSKRRINAKERRRRKYWKRERVDRVFIRKKKEYRGEIVNKIRNFVL